VCTERQINASTLGGAVLAEIGMPREQSWSIHAQISQKIFSAMQRIPSTASDAPSRSHEIDQVERCFLVIITSESIDQVQGIKGEKEIR
jgi:hypothetical protein